MALTCFYSPEYYLPLPLGHPFPMHKFPDAAAILYADARSRGLVELQRPPALSRHELELVHTPQYLNAIRDGTLSPYEINRIGLPAHPRLYRRSNYGAAGTVSAAKYAVDHFYAANLAGGTHHAFPERGHGFCVFNDVAISIRMLQQQTPSWQFLVVDTDAHQGNGTHAIFKDDPSVFTYSIHVGKNFPAKKEPGDCDVPLPRFASADEYLETLQTSLTKTFESLEPDFVFWISGADVHKDDRFGQLNLSMEDIRFRDRFVLELIKKSNARAVILYGGGYNKTLHRTAEIHAQTIRLSAKILCP